MSQYEQPAQTTTIHPKHVVLRFFQDALRLPAWMKIVLTLACVSGFAGLGGQIARHNSATTQISQVSAPAAPRTTETPHVPGSGFVGSGNSAPSSPDVTTPTGSTPAPTPTATETATPWMTRIGFSILLGYILGWAFRTFVRIMALGAVLLGAILSGLSYFHIVNVDMSTAANNKYASASAWMTDQADHLRDAATNHIPSSGAGLVGVFMGLRRRR